MRIKYFKNFITNLLSLPEKPIKKIGGGEKVTQNIRRQLLFLSVITFFASFLFFDSRFPFSRYLCLIAVVSFVIHFMGLIFFNQLRYSHFILLTRFNVILMIGAIHFSGGIISPFLIVYICILMSDTYLGVNTNFNIFSIIGGYLLVVFLEYFRLIRIYSISTTSIYGSGVGTFFVIFNTLGIMVITSYYFKILVGQLKLQLAEEQFLKDKMQKEMIKMESSAQLGFLVTRIAHDIRGPMAAIKGYAQLSQSESGISEQNKNDWLIVEKEVNRVVGLVEKMQRFIKPGTSQRNYVSLREVLEIVLTVISLDEKMQKIKLVKIFPEEDVFVFVNAEELQQVFFNLLKNALDSIIEAQRSDGEIGIKVYSENSWVTAVFKDNGVGMTAEVKEKIFTDFFTTKKGGMGLGMGIVRDIIYGHGGKLEIDSEFGKGTEMRVYLPMITGEESEQEAKIGDGVKILN